MRNLLALIFIAVFCSTIFAQESKYIVFTGLTDEEAENTPQGINVGQIDANETALYDVSKENYPSTIFLMYKNVPEHKDSYEHYIEHESLKNVQNPLRIYKKPLVWLDSIQYTDWDVVGPQKTKGEVEVFFKELLRQERIYMIDRRDFTADSLTVIEARGYEFAEY